MAIDQAAFAGTSMAGLFGAFASWLDSVTGPKKAAIKLHRFLPFFLEIEGQWSAVPTYEQLLQHFGAEGLRRVRLPMRWLRELHDIVVDPRAREADSERRRIEAILHTLDDRPSHAILAKAYVSYLQAQPRSASLAPKSLRLALRPAADILLLLEADGDLPDQATIDRYLNRKPGHCASLGGFANFMRHEKGVELAVRVDRAEVRRLQVRRLEKRLQILAQAPEEVNLDEWLSVALPLFHGLPRNAGRRAVLIDQEYESVPGVQAALGGRTYWVPSPQGFAGFMRSGAWRVTG
ncbi:hypothetical protein [Labrys sp. ZIDIC5]|uniref:hypothetical protein n=1 Tax=Labrys sedimenti TaxID=3106036 RepID=UPI002ACAC3C0|nr:hypothetical protein [Labrys sp. ZIDIC5]MDZ5453906.1 hypothetical protein [Labrys sp. ZIDIC5]